MAIMMQSKNMMSLNIRNIFFYLNKQYMNYGWDETEEDIRMGFTTLECELHNAKKALTVLKEKNKNNQKLCTAVNQYLRMLEKEVNNIKVN